MRIAIVDDDADQLDLTSLTLQADGHDCHVFPDGESLMRAVRRETFDLLVLDWQLPGMDGIEIVQWLRANMQVRVPILMLTNRSDERDIVEGLSSGADDFMIKPMRIAELRARVRALLRRAYPDPAETELAWVPYRFDPKVCEVRVDGRVVAMTQKEFDLALFLFRNSGRLVSRQHLLESVWMTNNPRDTDLMSRSLDTHISRVRSLLALRAEHGYRLSAVYGQGYRLEKLNES